MVLCVGAVEKLRGVAERKGGGGQLLTLQCKDESPRILRHERYR